MTLPFDGYPWFALGSSVALVVIFAWHLRRVIRSRPFADRRVFGLHVLVAVVLLVAAAGLVIASGHAFVGSFVGIDHDTFLVIGLSLTRGALLLGGLVLVLADRHY